MELAANLSSQPSATAILATAVLDGRSHNELLPIHQLPPELLYIIIETAYTQVSYKLLFTLRSVCKHWMEIIDSMPQLWAHIASHQNANLLSTILQKSTTQPLDVWCREGEGYHLGDGPTFEERVAVFLEHVGPSAARWGSLHYLAPANAQHEQILGLSFHNLETLVADIRGTAVDYTGRFNAPSIGNLDVSGLSLNWSSLSGLRSLQLGGCVPSPTINELYLLLTSSPDLELLKIKMDRSSPTGQTTDLSTTHSARIHLPRLRTLLITQVPFVSYSRLLDLVEAPNLSRFMVFQFFNFRSYDFTPMFESAGRLIGAFRHPRDRDDPSRLKISGDSGHLGVIVGNRRVILKDNTWTSESRRRERAAGLSTVIRQFDARLCDEIRVVRFSGIRDGQEMLDLAHIANRRLCNVVNLEVKLPTTSPHDGLSILGRMSSLPIEGSQSLWFPKLVALQFDVLEGMECDGILEVVKVRRNMEQVQAIRQLTIQGGKIRKESLDELKANVEELNLVDTKVI
ncbi:hypothetical protein FRC01_003624 [Tulasnella sp. 417]|nr:hypothetical protein FRC01_003624 [Tulasnella sp. 417]